MGVTTHMAAQGMMRLTTELANAAEGEASRRAATRLQEVADAIQRGVGVIIVPNGLEGDALFRARHAAVAVGSIANRARLAGRVLVDDRATLLVRAEECANALGSSPVRELNG